MGLGGGSIELNNMGVLHKNGAVFKGAKCLFAGSSQPFLHVSRGVGSPLHLCPRLLFNGAYYERSNQGPKRYNESAYE